MEVTSTVTVPWMLSPPAVRDGTGHTMMREETNVPRTGTLPNLHPRPVELAKLVPMMKTGYCPTVRPRAGVRLTTDMSRT